MERADRDIRCPVCDKMIRKGEQIVWENFRFYGTDRRLPMHARHDTSYSARHTKLAQLMMRAATNNDGFDPSDTYVI